MNLNYNRQKILFFNIFKLITLNKLLTGKKTLKLFLQKPLNLKKYRSLGFKDIVNNLDTILYKIYR